MHHTPMNAMKQRAAALLGRSCIEVWLRQLVAVVPYAQLESQRTKVVTTPSCPMGSKATCEDSARKPKRSSVWNTSLG